MLWILHQPCASYIRICTILLSIQMCVNSRQLLSTSRAKGGLSMHYLQGRSHHLGEGPKDLMADVSATSAFHLARDVRKRRCER